MEPYQNFSPNILKKEYRFFQSLRTARPEDSVTASEVKLLVDIKIQPRKDIKEDIRPAFDLLNAIRLLGLKTSSERVGGHLWWPLCVAPKWWITGLYS